MTLPISYFAAFPNTENQLFIHDKAHVQCTRYNKKRESFKA